MFKLLLTDGNVSVVFIILSPTLWFQRSWFVEQSSILFNAESLPLYDAYTMTEYFNKTGNLVYQLAECRAMSSLQCTRSNVKLSAGRVQGES